MKLFKNQKRFATILAATAAVMTIGWALAAYTNVLNPVFGHETAFANPPAAACIRVTDGINVNGANANATVNLQSGCGTRKLVMKAWYAPSATGAPHDQQVKFAEGERKTLTPGDAPYKLHVEALPAGCFYQYDLVDITNEATNTDGNPIVKAVTGGDHDCTPVTFACTSLTATPGIKDQTSGNQAFTLNVSATVKHGTIVKYDFNFGDGTSAAVPTSAISASAVHTYAPGSFTASATVTVKDAGGNLHTSPVGNCQTPISVTPPPPPEKKLVCDSLTATPGDVADNGNQAYNFTAKATAENTTVVSYTYNFGDGQSTTIPGATTSHTYAPGDYTASVTVNGEGGRTASSEACKAHITVKKPEVKLSCDSLTGTPGAIDAATGNQSFSFAAKATAQNTTISGYTFDFGDNSDDQTIPGATTTHTYAPGDYTAMVTVSAGDQKATSEKCKVQIRVKEKQNSSLVCTSLQLVPGAVSEDSSQSFTLKAAGSTTNATITDYVFSFGDASADATVATDQKTASTTHTYAPGNYTATVVVKGKDASGKPITAPSNTACSQPVTVAPPQPKNPAISLTKKVDGVKFKQVNVGQRFVYQVVITNTGEKDLANAVVTDAAPQGVTLISADLGAVANNSFSYTIPSLAVDASITVNITAVINAYVPGNVINTACVNAPEVNPDQPEAMDSCDTATVTVTPPSTPPTTTPPAVLGATTLVNTGPGGVAILAATVAIVSTFAYRLVASRKLAQ